MADKTLSELPEALELYDDSLLLVEQQGQAQNIRGGRVRAFAENALTKFIQGAGYLLTVGKVTTGAAGSEVKVTNSGTAQKPVLNFTIPRGATGAKGDKGEKGDEGPTGPQGAAGAKGADGVSPTVAISKSGTVTTVTITDAAGAHKATINDGAKGDTGPTGPAGPAGPQGPTGPQGPVGPAGGVTGVKGNAEAGGYRTGNVNLTAENIGTYDKSKIDSLFSTLMFGGAYHGNIDDLKGGNKIYWCNVTSAWTPPTSGTLPPNMSYFWLAVLSQSGSDCIQIAFAASEVKFFCVRTWINNRWYDWNRYIALQDGKVQTENLADGAVTSAKINNGAVISEKIGNKAVTSEKLDELYVSSSDSFGSFLMDTEKKFNGLRSGFFRWTTALTDGNKPYPSGVGLCIMQNDDAAVQLAVPTTTGAPHLVLRRKKSGTWEAWKEISLNDFTAGDEPLPGPEVVAEEMMNDE